MFFFFFFRIIDILTVSVNSVVYVPVKIEFVSVFCFQSLNGFRALVSSNENVLV